MSNYLEQLVERTLHRQADIQPRPASFFQPPTLFEAGGIGPAGLEIGEEVEPEAADLPFTAAQSRPERRLHQSERTPPAQPAAEYPAHEQVETTPAPARRPVPPPQPPTVEHRPAQDNLPPPDRPVPAVPLKSGETAAAPSGTVRPLTEIRQIINNIFNRESDTAAPERQPEAPEKIGGQVEPAKAKNPEGKRTAAARVRPVMAADLNGTELDKHPGQTAEKAPSIRVHIGRVEVRAVPAAPAPAPAANRPPPQNKAMSLDEYMNRRQEKRR